MFMQCLNRIIQPILVINRSTSTLKSKLLANYQFPSLNRDDCEQHFVSGWGPGGQKVNTSRNAVMLRHIETGIVIRVHESRLLSNNIDIAYERMKFALDRHINGDNCYQEQLLRIENDRQQRLNAKRRRSRQLKLEAKNRDII